MGHGADRGDKKVSADPLFRRIGKKGGAVRFAIVLNVSEQVVSNWKRRGIPPRELPRVAAALGLTIDEYLREAGYPGIQPTEGVKEPRQQYAFQLERLRDDFLALPEGLREYVARKTATLRMYADALPQFIRDALKPPTDPERYRTWERDIEADMLAKRLAAESTQEPTQPPTPKRPTPLGRIYGAGPSPKRITTKPRRHQR